MSTEQGSSHLFSHPLTRHAMQPHLTGGKVINDYRNIIILCLIALLLICFFSSAPGRLPPPVFGYRFFFVTGTSMEPTYFAGDLLVVKEVDCSEIVPGDIITFVCPYSEYGTTTHRVKSVSCDQQEIEVYSFITQGDARRLRDPLPIEDCDVVGKVVREFLIGGWFHRMRMPLQSDQSRQMFAHWVFKKGFYGYVHNTDLFRQMTERSDPRLKPGQCRGGEVSSA